MKMNNEKEKNERIGPEINKNTNLKFTKSVEAYFLVQMGNYSTAYDYDVIANELPHFKTLNYTEYAHCFIMHPLQLQLRVNQMMDAYNDNADQKINYVEFFKDRILNNNANKYADRKESTVYEPREAIVMLPGSNRLKDRICANKMKYIRDVHGKNVWFKPHPLTQHRFVGEMMDLLGEDKVLPRDVDAYALLRSPETKIVYTSALSESAVFSVCLDKQIEPIDVYYKMELASFYHINKFLFFEDNPKAWINKAFNSHKSGLICPIADPNWKQKMENYLEYIHKLRNKYKNKFI